MSEDPSTSAAAVQDSVSAVAPPGPVDAAPAASTAADDDDDDSVTERYKLPQDLYDNLCSMGFSGNAVKKSIVAGCIDENTCLQWLEMHLDHPDLNTDIAPGIRVDLIKKRVLTDEERAAKVEELKNKIAQNKKLEAETLKARAIEDEKRRIQMGKSALSSKEAREAAQRKADYEQRRREKEEDRLAKEKLQFELAIDRLVRGGMDRVEATAVAKKERDETQQRIADERVARLAQEQAAREREAAEDARRKAASASAGGWNLSRLVQPSESELAETAAGAPSAAGRGDLVVDFDREIAISSSYDVGVFSDILERSAGLCPFTDPRSVAGRQMLHRVLKAIEASPLDRKVRSLKVVSTVFTTKILPLPLSCLFLRQSGFQESSSSPELEAAGVSDVLTMSVCSLPKVRNALQALEAAF